jgi:hypothetical protein
MDCSTAGIVWANADFQYEDAELLLEYSATGI